MAQYTAQIFKSGLHGKGWFVKGEPRFTAREYCDELNLNAAHQDGVALEYDHEIIARLVATHHKPGLCRVNQGRPPNEEAGYIWKISNRRRVHYSMAVLGRDFTPATGFSNQWR